MGYILGGISIAIGAACCYFSSGVFVKIGMGLLVNGV